MATRLFDAVVKKNDSAQFQFAGNSSGETWTPNLFEVGTDGTVTQLNAGGNLSTGSAIANTKYYKVAVAPAAMTSGRSYFIEMVRTGDNASIRLPAFGFDMTDDIGVADDGVNALSVFGKIAAARSDVTALSNKIGLMGATNLQTLSAVLGVAGFEAANKSLHGFLTDGTFGLSQLRTQINELSADLNSEVATSFSGVAGGTFDTVAKALRKIYDEVDMAEEKSDSVLGRLGGTDGAMSFTAPILSGATNVQGVLDLLATEMGDTSSVSWGGGVTAPLTQAAALAKIYVDLKGYTDDLENRIGTASTIAGSSTVFGDLKAIHNRIGASTIAENNSVAQDLQAIYTAVSSSADVWDDVIRPESGAGAGDSVMAKAALLSVYDKVNHATYGLAQIKGQTQTLSDAFGTKPADTNLFQLVGLPNDSTSATTIFGRLAAMLDKSDTIASQANAALRVSMIPSIKAPLTGSVAVKFEAKVTDPYSSTSAVEDPDGNVSVDPTWYFAHVRAEGRDGKTWGSRLFSDGALTAALTVRSDAAEPTQTAVDVDDTAGSPAAVEMWYRLARTSAGMFRCFVKVLPKDGGSSDGSAVTVSARIRDSDPTAKPVVFVESTNLSVLPLSSGGGIGAFV